LPKLPDEDEIRRIVRKKDPLPKMKRDSDDVYDLGPVSRILPEECGKEITKDHTILDTPWGYCINMCPETERGYLHIIKVPNKFALICRGCGAEI